MKYLVTGATGHLGSLVIEELLNLVSPDEIAVSVRDLKKAAQLKEKGIEVRYGNFDEPESLKTAFAGVERLLLISADGDNETRIRQHLNAVAAAKEAGVRFIAYTSATNAKKSELFLAIVHKTTEEAIEETNIPHAFLRDNWYLENEASSIAGVLAKAPWISASKEGRVGWSLRRDYAQAAAYVLTGKVSKKEVYELSGTPLTQKELAKLVGEVLDTTIEVLEVSKEEYAQIMKQAGVPESIIPMLVAIQSDIEKNTLNWQLSDLEEVIGRPQTPLKEGIAEIVKQYSK